MAFNIAFALRVDSAIALLTRDPALRDADIVLLQEMDEPGTRRIAGALGLGYVYYPAIRSGRTGRDFGNAVLSVWPIVEDAKLVLPHHSLFSRTQRIATAATLRVGDELVRVYSVHLGTLLEIGPGARRAQLGAVLDDAAAYDRVIIGGDMNSHGIGGLALARGFAWPTREGPRTTAVGRWDHLFVRGLGSAASAAGTVKDVRDASDHLPVWAVLAVR